MSRPPCCARPARSFSKCPTAVSAIFTPSASSTKPRAKCRWNCGWKIPRAALTVMGQGSIVVAPQKLSENSVLIELDPAAMKSGATPLVHRRLFRRQKIANAENRLHRPAQLNYENQIQSLALRHYWLLFAADLRPGRHSSPSPRRTAKAWSAKIITSRN